MLSKYEKETVNVLLNAGEHSSRDIWEAFVNASPEVLLSYAIAQFGEEEVREKLTQLTAKNKS